jgi:hypothetical protein
MRLSLPLKISQNEIPSLTSNYFSLIDSEMFKEFKTLSPSSLISLQLDLHLTTTESRQVALELVYFLTKHSYFSNYTDYIKSEEGRAIVTKYVQEKNLEIDNKSFETSNKPEKRARDTGETAEKKDEDILADAESLAREKRAKKAGAQWYWASDSPKGEQVKARKEKKRVHKGFFFFYFPDF